jgi:SepF-like predicted cell division protein (DUF552 family)
MKRFFSNVMSRMGISETADDTPAEDGYVELDTEVGDSESSMMYVRTFVIKEFEDIKIILDKLRKGGTIALVNIKPLKDKDIVELKRAINKLKKTCDAIEGEIAGFGEDWIVATPSSVRIHKNKETETIRQDDRDIIE